MNTIPAVLDTADKPEYLTYSFEPLDKTDKSKESSSTSNDASKIQLAQIPGGDLELKTPAIDNKDAMDTIPSVQDLEPEWEEYKPPKTVKGKAGSYLQIDYFNDRVAPGMAVAKDRNQEDAHEIQALHEPTFSNPRNGGPGIVTEAASLVWNSKVGAPHLVWDWDLD
jgi:hypothetical protein